MHARTLWIIVLISSNVINVKGLRVLAPNRKLLLQTTVINYTVPRCDRINEYFTCGSPCQNTCKHLREPCLIKSRYCQESCHCLPGYARDDRESQSGILICIPEWQCDNPKGKCPGENEVFNPNGRPCQTTCARLGLPCPIVDALEVPGCFCKSGFARDAHGVCIHQDKCSPGRCSDVHEVYKSVNCPQFCANIRGCNSDELYENTAIQCVCQTGFVRRIHDNKCVPETLCYGPNFQHDINE